MHPFTLPQQGHIVQALNPATDAAGRNGDWVNLKNAHKAYIIAHIAQGNAATVALSIQKAQDIAGTGATNITANVRIWAALDAATTDVLVEQAQALNFTTDAALKNKVVVFEIDPASLGEAFPVIRVVTGASNVANLTQAVYVLTPTRYSAATLPSARV
jgi:hypothetical protein